MDGSSAPKPPAALESVAGDAVLTTVVVSEAGEITKGSRAGECLGDLGPEIRPSGKVVDRIGVSSESVTLRDASGLYACDNSPGPREADRRWCGKSFGHLHDGSLLDPRLDVGCTTIDGGHVGFIWVQPSTQARYVAVEQPGYSEVYETAGGLPVRVASTSGVEIEGSSASFDITEHDSSGILVRRYTLDAKVAG